MMFLIFGTLRAHLSAEFNSNAIHEEEIMKKRTLVTMIGMVSGLALSTAVFAADTGSSVFSTLDADQDGSISADEAAASPELSKNWSTIDADENGVVDAAEFSAFEGAMGGESSGEAVAPAEGQ
jgi:Ca2+-binding EF-hand superfamily protein